MKKVDEIFTTGAFVKPIEVEINGVKQWRWIVDRFEDFSDNYFDGDCVSVYDYADSYEKLFRKDYR